MFTEEELSRVTDIGLFAEEEDLAKVTDIFAEEEELYRVTVCRRGIIKGDCHLQKYGSYPG